MNPILLNFDDPVIRTYLDYAFLSGIIKNKRSAENYYYSNYGNICFEHSFYKKIWDSFDLFPAPRIPDWNKAGIITLEGFNTWGIGDDCQRSIIDIIEEKLNKKKYIYIALDDYELIGRPNYRKNHYIHHVLITGIDQKKHCLAATSYFLTKKNDFGLIWIPFKTIEKAYNFIPRKLKGFGQESFSIWWSNYFETIEVNSNSGFSFNLSRVVSELEGFLNSTPTEEQHNSHNKNLKAYEVSYGLKAYNLWKQFIEMADAGTIDISAQPVRLFYEHKAFMLAKCEFINLRGYAVIKSEIMDQLREAVKAAFRFRMLLFETLYKTKKPDYKEIANWLERCRRIEERSYEQLFKVLDKMTG